MSGASATAPPALVRAEGLRSRYGGRASPEVLQGIDLVLQPGEVLGLVGPNGSGKSSLLKCLAGLRPLSGGHLALEGRALAGCTRQEIARAVAYVPQHTGPGMSLRVLDMVRLGRLPHRGASSPQQDEALCLAAIERLALEALALRHFSDLSGGERQRVLMARAWAQQGRLLLLDEPTSDLDLRHQLATLQTVRELSRQRGAGAVIAIHDLALAARFCDRLLMLRGGRVLDAGAPAQVLTPTNVQALFGVGARIGTDGGLPYVIPMDPTPNESPSP
ncbi:ABC transporter ATP-binding protein [Acidovorax sp. SUPP2539]|uniref:ABC transporter ATP-binding protein n=1 Tax=Acidovorax sp. SUPP2539 TaxID=2920878 RepID=UPI0023DE32A4|nr:ABC transporter ATP-binding protein [Acidovorax sp. SUPP2539]GKS91551.1 ABC transporter ATP-binding protein [Acidovorax sp. SUPP2539]